MKKDYDELLSQNELLKDKVQELEDTINAIRSGEVDALIVETEKGDQVFSLTSADTSYRLFIEQMTEGAAILSEDGVVIYCNDAFMNVLHNPEQPIVGNTIDSFLNNSQQKQFHTLLQQGLSKPVQMEFTFSWIEKQKSYERSYLFAAAPFIEEYSEKEPDVDTTKSVSLTTHDVTILKQGEYTIDDTNEESIETFKTVSLIAYDVTDLKNLEKELKEHKINLEQTVDKRTKELKSTNLQISASEQQLRAANEKLKESINRYKNLETEHKEYEKELEASQRATLNLMEDALEQSKKLKESETRYRSLIDQMPDGLLLHDSKGNINEVNLAAEIMFDYSKEELLEMNIRELDPNFEKKIIAEKLYDKINLNQSISFEADQIRKGGKIFPSEITVTKLKLGDKTKFMGISRDITERKTAEKMIEQSLREKEVLLRELYHRTKNNMQVISSLISLRASVSKDQTIIAAYNDVNSKIKSMALVHKKLYESKNLSNIDLKEYIIELVELIQRSQENIKNKVIIILDMKKVIANIDLVAPLGLAINELVSNAFKHAFPDSRTGKLEIILYYDRNKKINLKIHDNGVAIDPKIDLRKSKSMGLQIMFQLIEYQLQGKIDYKVDNGLKWHIILDDKKFKARV